MAPRNQIPDAVIDQAEALVKAGHSVNEAAVRVGISTTCLHRHLKRRGVRSAPEHDRFGQRTRARKVIAALVSQYTSPPDPC